MLKVMIVDDSAFMRMFLKDIVFELECEVVAEASNGLEAIELCKKCNPDVITLDITMPGMDGLDVLKEIRRTNQKVHIIMVSDMGQQAFIKQAISFGANDYLVKPFGKERIVTMYKDKIAANI